MPVLDPGSLGNGPRCPDRLRMMLTCHSHGVLVFVMRLLVCIIVMMVLCMCYSSRGLLHPRPPLTPLVGEVVRCVVVRVSAVSLHVPQPESFIALAGE